MKANKQKIVDEFLIELEKGISYSECLVLNGSKWNFPKTTFTRYWNIANEAYRLRQQSINSILLEQSTELQKQRLKKAILTKEESLSILSELAKNASKETDKINAVKTLADLQGWKAPTKTEVTNITPLLINDPIFNESDYSTKED